MNWELMRKILTRLVEWYPYQTGVGTFKDNTDYPKDWIACVAYLQEKGFITKPEAGWMDCSPDSVVVAITAAGIDWLEAQKAFGQSMYISVPPQLGSL